MELRRWIFVGMTMALAGTPASLRSAELSSTKGSVEIKKSGKAMWSQAKMKDGVTAGDVIRTGAGSSAQLSTKEGHKVDLRERTTARVDSTDNGDSRIFLEIGKLRAKVAKLRGANKFEVRTPLAAASVRGTVFDMSVGEDQSSTLSVLEGQVAYKELGGSGQENLVGAGQELTFTSPSDKKDNGQDSKKDQPSDDGKDDKKEEGQKTEGPKTEDQQTASVPEKEVLREEVLRETDLSLEKEFQQEEVSRDLREEVAQEGKVLIDRLGRRVRFEEYLTRGADNRSYTQTYISYREGRTDQARYSVYAAAELPKDLSQIDLFGSRKGFLEKNHAVADEWFTTNGDTYYREWRDGGQPVDFTDPNNGERWRQVVFGDWFVEFKGAGDPVLLSHWQATDGYRSGNPFDTLNQDQTDVFGNSDMGGDGALDIPTGYRNYVHNQEGPLGDDNFVDGISAEKRLYYFESRDIASRYQNSEGFERDSRAFYDGKEVIIPNGTFEGESRSILDEMIQNSTQRTILSTYFTPNEDKIVLRVDSYYVSDKGYVVPFGKIGPSILGFEGLHREEVYSSSLDKRDIDVVIGPSSQRQEVTEDVPYINLR